MQCPRQTLHHKQQEWSAKMRLGLDEVGLPAAIKHLQARCYEGQLEGGGNQQVHGNVSLCRKINDGSEFTHSTTALQAFHNPRSSSLTEKNRHIQTQNGCRITTKDHHPASKSLEISRICPENQR